MTGIVMLHIMQPATIIVDKGVLGFLPEQKCCCKQKSL